MLKRTLCVFTVLLASFVAPQSAGAVEPLSDGCTRMNAEVYDSTYIGLVRGDPIEFFAGEVLHISAATPSPQGAPTTIFLKIDGVTVDSDAFPGELSYTFTSSGAFEVEWGGDNPNNTNANATWTVSCQNTPPDCSTVTASTTAVKADGKLHQVTLSGATDPFGQSVTLTVTGVTQDEPTTGGWRNDVKSPDAGGVSGASASVRGERNPTLNGRVYRIHYTATDASGSTCSGYETVGVAVRRGVDAIDDGDQASWNSFTGALI